MTLARKQNLPSAIPDDQLVEASLAGDKEAFQLIYRKYIGKVRSILCRLAQNSHLDDMTQEAFINIWRNLERVRATESISAWVYRLTVNVAMDNLRQKQRRGSETTLEEVPSTLDEAHVIESRQLVSAGLATLDFAHRSVIVLHDLEQFTEQEIADILSIPRGTVKSRLHNARSKLREFFAKHGVKNE